MRTLKRPMFRMGGTADQGITSGLAPRQGYAHEAGHVVQNDPQKISDIKDMSLEQLRELSKSMSYKPRGGNVYDFLTEFGLNIASTPPQGNILSTAAASAKEPYSKFLKGKQDAAQMGYASEADMFKTLIGAQAKILGSEGGSKLFSKEQAAQAVSKLMGEWQDLRDQEKDMDPKDFADQKAIIFGQIQQYQKENPALGSLFDDKNFVKSIKSKIKTKLKQSQKKITVPNPDGEGTIEMTEAEYYANPENVNALYQEMGKLYMEYYNDMMTLGAGAMAEGGRAGYDQGGMIMPAEQAPDETIPAEMTNISEGELRRRLPPEVGDDVVKLLANSAEALEDFAMIKTAQDIARFNKKYGVDLTLPAEA